MQDQKDDQDWDIPRMLTALEEAQAEMRRDQAERLGGGCNFDLDGTARLALAVGNIVDLAPTQRPAAHHGSAVLAIGGAAAETFACEPRDTDFAALAKISAEDP